MEPKQSVRVLGVLMRSMTRAMGILSVVTFLIGATIFWHFIFAAGQQINPNGAGVTNQGTQTTCGASVPNWECINDGVSSTSIPSTGGDYLTFARNQLDTYQMDTISNVAIATAVTVFIYHIEGSTNMQFEISLWNATESAQYGTAVNVTNRTSSQWDSVTFSGLSLTQTLLDGLRVRTTCLRTGAGGATTCRDFALYAYVTYTPEENVTVSATGTQQNLDVGTTTAHVGGKFAIRENSSGAGRAVTSVKLNEVGTVDAQTNLNTIRLYYDIDTSAPLDCVAEDYSGNEPQYGATSTSFDAPNGTSTFTGSVTISTSQTLCLYPVLNVATTASAGETIELQINDPSVNVEATGGIVGPTSSVAIASTTVLQKVRLEQNHYHWRNDNGTETTASSTNGTEDSVLAGIAPLATKRLRLEVSNEGNKTTPTSARILNAFTTGNTKTISTGTNRLLLVGIASEDTGTNVNVNTVTYGGQTLTQVDDRQIGGGFANGMWVGYLRETGIQAASGNTIVPTWVGGTPDTAVLYSSIVFEYVDQINPIPAWSSNTGTAISTIQPTTTIAVNSGDVAVYFTSSGATGQTHTPASGYTEGTEQDSGGSGSVAANAYKTISSGGTEQPTADWTNPQNRLLIAAVTVQFGINFQIEYAQKSTTCNVATDWTDVGKTGGDWDMSDSVYLTDAEDTTNILLASFGAVTDSPGHSFLSPNTGVKDIYSSTDSITLTSTQFVELEYSMKPTASAVEGNTYCFRVTNGGTPIDTYTVYPQATISADLTVSASSTQVASVDIPTTNKYMGGLFVLKAQTAGPHTVSSITITASGTVDFQNDLEKIRLYYDTDTSAPYNCTGQSFSGNEPQYGATTTGGFSASGTSTFSGSFSVSSTQSMCLYVVLDVTSSTTDGETLDIQIGDPPNDISIGGGSIAPSTLVGIPGVTTFVNKNVDQIHYHFRNNDGVESLATSYTNGAEDTPATQVIKQSPIRLRIEVSNEGGTTTPAEQYRIEWTQKVSTCDVATGWVDVGVVSDDDWDMAITSGLVEGNSTTNFPTTTLGALTDENSNFLVSNGGQRETTSQTGNITLLSNEFVELEYALYPTSNATEGATYCFRLTNAGMALDTYSVYPEATIKPSTDFMVQRNTTILTGSSVTITAGVDYIAPSASTSAFIRITNTHNTGAGDSSGAGNQNADDVTAYVLNPWNIGTSITFARFGTGGDTRIDWEILEYKGAVGGENELIVRQQQYVTYTTTGTTVNTGTVPGVSDDNDIVVFITGQGNPDIGRNDYNTVLSTAAWNAGSDTATFTRGEASGDAVATSYAVVEFTGSNWKVQRTADHTYTSAGTTETESITAVNSLSRAFIHTQKRVGAGLQTHEDFGQQVSLSGVGQVSFLLDSGANTPSGHVGVAWIIENTQTTGDVMEVTRTTGTESGGTAPLTTNVPITKTLDDMSVSSIFTNNSGSGSGSTWPEPMMGVKLISTTQYQLWQSNTGDSRTYRTEVVEWPTARRKFTQNYYQLYEDDEALNPSTPWPCQSGPCGENTEITGLDNPIVAGDSIRIRMTIQISAASMVPNIDAFKLQYGIRNTTCSAISEDSWLNLGDIGSTTAVWRGHAGTPADGTALSGDPPTGGDLKITSVSDIAGTYEENNPTALTPYLVTAGEDIEFDWAIENNSAPQKTTYCFRMLESDGTALLAFNNYPTLRTAGYGPQSQNWRWYDDGENETPLSAPQSENVAPFDIAFDDILQLRLTLREVNGAQSTSTKFKLQFSEFSDFSTVADVVAIGACGELSLWCYVDGSGTDNATITAKLLSDADTCSGGVGAGCGTHNEAPTTTSTHNHNPGDAAEFSFTLKNAGARVNRTYFFRVYDVAHDEEVPLGSGKTYPSLSTEGASLTFTLSGLPSGTMTEGTTTDATTTPNSINFGRLQSDDQIKAAHRLIVTTNATEGYKILMYSTGELSSSFGTIIASTTGTNATPVGWTSGCDPGAAGCFGYHGGDDVLEGGSTRFSATDTYASLDNIPEEIVFSSLPVIDEVNDILYRLHVRQLQEAGVYETGVVYIAVPVF